MRNPATGAVWAVVFGASLGAQAPATAPTPPVHPGLVRVQTETPEARADWDRRLARMVKVGALKLRERRAAADGASRDEWLVQLHKGVPVAGAEVWRRLTGAALASADGVIYEKIAVNPVPKLTRVEARQAVMALAPNSAGPSRDPELVVLPTADGNYRLVYRARVFDGTTPVVHYLDASTGAVVLSEPDPPMPSAR